MAQTAGWASLFGQMEPMRQTDSGVDEQVAASASLKVRCADGGTWGESRSGAGNRAVPITVREIGRAASRRALDVERPSHDCQIGAAAFEKLQ